MELHLVDPAVLEVVILEGLPQQRDLVLGHLSPFQGRQGPLLVLVEPLILKVAKLVCKFIKFPVMYYIIGFVCQHRPIFLKCMGPL